MHLSLFRSLAIGLLYVTLLSCSTKDVVTPTPPAGARAAAVGVSYECDVAQGFKFMQDVHATFGYITSWSIGDNAISPDLKVEEPNSLGTVAANAGTTGNGEMNTADIFQFPVVSVLTNLNWSTLATDNITFQGRISQANAQTLRMLTQSIGSKRTVMKIGFVVYQYDFVNQVYYTSFKSYQGSVPNGSSPVKSSGAFGNTDASSIYALLGKNSAGGVGITVGAKAESYPAGIRNYTFDLTLAPAISSSPQQMLIQTSTTRKLIQPWGLPQK